MMSNAYESIKEDVEGSLLSDRAFLVHKMLKIYCSDWKPFAGKEIVGDCLYFTDKLLFPREQRIEGVIEPERVSTKKFESMRYYYGTILSRCEIFDFLAKFVSDWTFISAEHKYNESAKSELLETLERSVHFLQSPKDKAILQAVQVCQTLLNERLVL